VRRVGSRTAPEQVVQVKCRSRETDPKLLKQERLRLVGRRGTEYPAARNGGHLYEAKLALRTFHESLDPKYPIEQSSGRRVGGLFRFQITHAFGRYWHKTDMGLCGALCRLLAHSRP
jgi:hypothetical protein